MCDTLKFFIMIKRIVNVSSEIEAARIKDILDEHGIAHMIRSFHDSAYDGMFQSQYGWGVLEADEADEAQIIEILKENSPDDVSISD